VTEPPAPSVRAWLGFTAMAVGMFFAILDIQIVASSILDIQLALKIPADRLSYIQTTYLIAEVIAIALSGWLTKVMSTRWLFVVAMTGFVLASVGCAASQTYQALLVFRFIQGLFGGAIIPLVFTAAFLLFPPHRQALATMIGGGLAMLAPTVGPYVGGWITESWSWHWLFLINLAPGIAVAAVVATTVRIDKPQWAVARSLDVAALTLLVVFLATMQLALKELPHLGWTSASALILNIICLASGTLLVRRCLSQGTPLVNVRAFLDRNFAVGAGFSFVLGMALFGSVYVLPLYLGIVRGHGPLEIGTIMIVMGAAQLLVAPLAATADTKIDPRLMAFVGFAIFAAGLASNALSTPAWDSSEVFWPQVLRGTAVMLCLLPITRLALSHLSPGDMAQASALFNLMRNIGGAVGLALVDTIIENRSAHHADLIAQQLQAGDRAMAAFVGLPLERFTGQPLGPIDATAQEFARPLVERAAATMSFNDAWTALAAIVALSLVLVVFVKRRGPGTSQPQP
jgi:MFS transporter, DHA2 family, multidrug resistance protein